MCAKSIRSLSVRHDKRHDRRMNCRISFAAVRLTAGTEAHEVPSVPIARPTWPERETQEVEPLYRIRLSAIGVLAVHELRFSPDGLPTCTERVVPVPPVGPVRLVPSSDSAREY